MYVSYTLLTLACVVAGVLWGVYRCNDTLHPLVFLMPAAGYFYVVIPFFLDQSGALRSFFRADELLFVQELFLACAAALCAGGIWGSKGVRRNEKLVDRHTAFAAPVWIERLYRLSLILGGVGVTLYVYSLINVGGFVEAYNSAKGGGWAASGYVRDFQILVIPAIVLLYMSRQGDRWKIKHSGLLVLFSSPLVIHGLLGARRGPTFVGIVTLVVGWYVTRYRRPKLWQVAAGGAVVGLLLLTLVSFRGQIYLGSSLLSGKGPDFSTLVEESVEQTGRSAMGNEFIYGGKAALLAREQNNYYWGGRYLTYIFIRPIPSAIWPNKYRDVGMEELLWNAGVIDRSATEVSWLNYIPTGSAPTFGADLFVEFGWMAVLAAFGAGWLFAFFWRRSLIYGGIWKVVYVGALALSLYFVSQSVGAMLFRFLEVSIPVALAWDYLSYRHRRAIHKLRKRVGILSSA